MQLYFKSDSRIKRNKRTKTTFIVPLMFSYIVHLSLHLIFLCAFKLTSSMLSLQPEGTPFQGVYASNKLFLSWNVLIHL